MKTFMVVFLMMTGCVVLNAQDTALVQPPILPPESEQEINRERIQIRDLPEAVREALKAPDYAGWTVDSAYRSLAKNPERPGSKDHIVYIIDLKRGAEKASIRFDGDGKRLDDSDND